MRTTPHVILTLAALTALVACGGGGGGDSTGGVIPDGGSSVNLTLGFDPDQPSPPPSGSVTLQPGTSSGNSVSLLAQVTDVNDVYGATFDLVFDASAVEYVGHSPGSFLEDGGASVEYQVQPAGAGRLVVGVTRLGATTGANAVGTRTLVRLTFRARAAGTSLSDLQNQALLDDQPTPAPIPGLLWAAGEFFAN